VLERYGWSDALQAAFAPYAARGLFPARVIAHHRGLWRLVTRQGETAGRLSGRFALDAAPGDHPVVGDWLAIGSVPESADAVIHALLPRRTVFSRRAAGGGETSADASILEQYAAEKSAVSRTQAPERAPILLHLAQAQLWAGAPADAVASTNSQLPFSSCWPLTIENAPRQRPEFIRNGVPSVPGDVPITAYDPDNIPSACSMSWIGPAKQLC
jgi:ribosome biogenesis GTPase